jgi:hypothetical protein
VKKSLCIMHICVGSIRNWCKSLLFLWLTFVSLEAPASYAAQLAVLKNNECTIKLNGLFTSGDAEKLKLTIEAFDIEHEYNTFIGRTEFSLCLDSPGGSFAEGQLVSQVIHDKGLPTKIVAGAECYSACAFAFMAGRSFGDEADGTNRTLNIGGKLGFHAPFLSVHADSNKTLSADEVSQFIVKYNSIVSKFIEFGSFTSYTSSKASFPISLLVEVFKTGPNDLIYVDTVQKLAMWEIKLGGHKKAAQLTSNSRRQLCANIDRWSTDQASTTLSTDMMSNSNSAKITRIIGAAGHQVTYEVITFSGEADISCDVEITNEPSEGVRVCLANGYNGLGLGRCRDEEAFSAYFPWYFSLPPETVLEELKQ